MDEIKATNQAVLCGIMSEKPRLSHESRGERFFVFPLEVYRLSGTSDVINIVVRERLLKEVEIAPAERLCVIGELRSFNNRSGEGSRLVITVFARQLALTGDADDNCVQLSGTICKTPNLRATPMGREICDLMLAVNRRYGRSDYLPCIAWGLRAKQAAQWQVGDSVSLTGRIQSRRYIKLIGGAQVEKTAFEVSVIELSRENE